jgi:hypothetical protein
MALILRSFYLSFVVENYLRFLAAKSVSVSVYHPLAHLE